MELVRCQSVSQSVPSIPRFPVWSLPMIVVGIKLFEHITCRSINEEVFLLHSYKWYGKMIKRNHLLLRIFFHPIVIFGWVVKIFI